MLAYCWLDTWKLIPVTFESKYVQHIPCSKMNFKIFPTDCRSFYFDLNVLSVVILHIIPPWFWPVILRRVLALRLLPFPYELSCSPRNLMQTPNFQREKISIFLYMMDSFKIVCLQPDICCRNCDVGQISHLITNNGSVFLQSLSFKINSNTQWNIISE